MRAPAGRPPPIGAVYGATMRCNPHAVAVGDLLNPKASGGRSSLDELARVPEQRDPINLTGG